ncbi:phage antirepressor KilAC domain-containing protein [Allisonella histaminiformans]|uniref:phage antirepressor KilAC domain-containing protein n=1 Tax=Allisonella histaminiformans TaxID=209880 RepID=UPI002E7A7E08|nr:phage antirepressor KilAC domain-containing protein [Allisonella histaminiformans]
MNAVKIFKNSEFGEIRIVPINNEPWFIGSEIAKILSYTNPSKAIRDHVDPEEKLTERIVLAGQRRDVTVINESGLYSLILSSKLPSAKRFKHWVTSEVLPAVRKFGGYLTQEKMEEALLNPDVLIKLATQLKSEREARKRAESLNEQNKPKVLFADSVSVADDAILIGALAKLIKQNGVDIGQNRLFQKLRDMGYLIKSGQDKNMPTQKAMNMKLFRVKERTVGNPDGSVRTTRTTLVTGKGQIYFINLFLERRNLK